MVRFRKRRFRRRRTRRNFRSRRRGKMRIVRVRPETKHNHQEFSNLAVDDLGTSPINLTGIPSQGTGTQQYVGNRVSPKLIQINLTMRVGFDAANIRWYVVQWLVDDTLDVFTVAKYLRSLNVNSFTDYNDRYKFRTLKKGTIAASKNSADETGVFIRTLTIRPRANVYFFGAAGAATKNHIFFFAISEINVATAPLMSLQSRMLYTDA